MSFFASFHLLRPEWLLLFIPAGWVFLSLLRRQDARRSWTELIEPRLLEHLVVEQEEGRRRIRPVHVLGVAWALAILILAGPAWQKEQTPFTEDQAAVFIVLKVTPDMLAADVQPSRLQRASQKIKDLLELRPGSKAGLVAYAGSAHLVTPLTSDPEVIRYFASELTPDVMPLAGDAPAQALQLAAGRLERSGLPGSIVLVADYVDPAEQAAIREIHDASGIDIHVLAMAAGDDVIPPPGSPPAPALDREAMSAAANAGGGTLVTVTPDNSDVVELGRRIERSIASAPVQEGERWRDSGYYLMPIFLLACLAFFRKGGGVALQR
jgi:Ca-activated chloride channel family protein